MLDSALKELGLECPYLNESAVDRLKKGSYSEAIDLVQWVKALVEHLGEPLYYHAEDVREEAKLANPSKQQKAKQRAAAVEAAAAKPSAKTSARRPIAPTGATVSRRAALAGTAAPPTRTPTANTSAPPPRTALGTVTNQPRTAPTKQQQDEVVRLKEKIAQLQGEVAAARAEKEEMGLIANQIATKYGTGLKKVKEYLSGHTDVPSEVHDQVVHILTTCMQ
eukprot:Sspe_Gene.50751::Locus_28233_Transcript_1_1_Confidence_1.000_Length_1112::g.50751::m.50751